MNKLQRNICERLLKLRPAFLASLIKKVVLVKREICITPYGKFLIDPCSNFGHYLLNFKIYEPHTIKILQNNLKLGDFFIDVGAGEGYFSVIASSIVGNKGKVFAIEPQHRLLNIITKNLELNNCRNVVIVSLAISDKNSEIGLYLTPGINTGGSSPIRVTHYPLRKQKTKSITLTELFNIYNITICDLLKVDIEGWEYDAILGSAKIFKENKVKAIALSLHTAILKRRGLPESNILNLLTSCGYITHDNLEFTLHSQH